MPKRTRFIGFNSHLCNVSTVASQRLSNDNGRRVFPASRMNYLIFLLSGIFIGLIVAVPIGPVNLLCIRRTLAFGPLNGFVAGVGAAMGDGTFAIVIGFGLTAVRDWIEHHSTAIQLGGGCL